MERNPWSAPSIYGVHDSSNCISGRPAFILTSKGSLDSSLLLKFTIESILPLCLYTQLLLYSLNALSPSAQEHYSCAKSFPASLGFQLSAVSAHRVEELRCPHDKTQARGTTKTSCSPKNWHFVSMKNF